MTPYYGVALGLRGASSTEHEGKQGGLEEHYGVPACAMALIPTVQRLEGSEGRFPPRLLHLATSCSLLVRTRLIQQPAQAGFVFLSILEATTKQHTQDI